MISKAKACPGGGCLINYVILDNKGYELKRNLVSGQTAKEIADDFRIFQNQNRRATNKTFSFVISPDPDDAEKLTDEVLISLSDDFLKALQIDFLHQQFIVYVHTEKKHKHLHIIANRVRPDGSLVSDSNIGFRAQTIGHNLAKKYGLISARDIRDENRKKRGQMLRNVTGIKKEIMEKHLFVMAHSPPDFEAYMNDMKKEGIQVNLSKNNNGQIQGFRYEDIQSGSTYKGSEIHRKLSLGKLLELGMPFKTAVVLKGTILKSQKLGEIKKEKNQKGKDKTVIPLKKIKKNNRKI